MKKALIITLYAIAGLLVGEFMRQVIFSLEDNVSEKYIPLIYTLAPVMGIMGIVVGIIIGINRGRNKEEEGIVVDRKRNKEEEIVNTTKKFKPNKTLYFITYTIGVFILSFGFFISLVGLMGSIWNVMIGFIIVAIGYLLMKLAKRFKN